VSKAIGIDGRYGEGGGQILRTTLALSALLRRPVEIHHIRGGRKKPGLRPQHLMAVKAMASISSARVKGAELGSMHLVFEPRQIKTGDYRFDVGTAGSTSLVLQTIIPALFFAGHKSRVVITGGTHVPWSPCYHYVREVFAPALREMGGSLMLKIEGWGWYPKGGGKISASISPARRLRAIERASRGKMQALYLLSALSNLPKQIGERQRDQVIRRLNAEGLKVAKEEPVDAPSPGEGTVVFIWSRFENGNAGFTSLGRKGKRAEKVADDACSQFLRFEASEASVDTHLADQLVLFMALAEGRSSLITESITTHLKTNMWVIEKFLPVRFDADPGMGRVSVVGVGFSV
jgi:RNA 3'-phosphate cyclase